MFGIDLIEEDVDVVLFRIAGCNIPDPGSNTNSSYTNEKLVPL